MIFLRVKKELRSWYLQGEDSSQKMCYFCSHILLLHFRLMSLSYEQIQSQLYIRGRYGVSSRMKLITAWWNVVAKALERKAASKIWIRNHSYNSIYDHNSHGRTSNNAQASDNGHMHDSKVFIKTWLSKWLCWFVCMIYPLTLMHWL